MDQPYRLCATSLFVALVLFFLPEDSLYAQRAIPDDNLAYPVLFTSPANVGSGFYLNTKVAMYFVTAKHVLFDDKGKLRSTTAQLLSNSRDPRDAQDNLFVLDLQQLQADGRISSHSRMDVAVVKIATLSAPPAESKAGRGAVDKWCERH